MIEFIFAFIIFLVLALVSLFGNIFMGINENLDDSFANNTTIEKNKPKKTVTFLDTRNERVFSKKKGKIVKDIITPTFNAMTDH